MNCIKCNKPKANGILCNNCREEENNMNDAKYCEICGNEVMTYAVCDECGKKTCFSCSCIDSDDHGNDFYICLACDA